MLSYIIFATRNIKKTSVSKVPYVHKNTAGQSSKRYGESYLEFKTECKHVKSIIDHIVSKDELLKTLQKNS